MGEQKTVIDLDGFTSCVCSGRAVPNKLCDGELAFEEKGKKVTLSLRIDERTDYLRLFPKRKLTSILRLIFVIG